MKNVDKIEFYDCVNGGLIADVSSSMVPPVKSLISIRKKTYQVKRITYAIDDTDYPSLIKMRANVDLFLKDKYV